jgi:hypothetical protein
LTDFNHLLVHDHSKVHQSSWNPVLVIFSCRVNSHRSIVSLLEWLTTKLIYHFSRRLQMQDFKAHNKPCLLVKNSMGCPFSCHNHRIFNQFTELWIHLCFSPLWCKNVMLHHTAGVILWRKTNNNNNNNNNSNTIT